MNMCSEGATVRKFASPNVLLPVPGMAERAGSLNLSISRAGLVLVQSGHLRLEGAHSSKGKTLFFVASGLVDDNPKR